MFIEPNIYGAKRGWIEVICGSMFSGKTEELIRRLKRAHIANLKVITFKPATDKRYHKSKVVSHNAVELSAIPVIKSGDITALPQNVDVIGIDEAQFFDTGIVNVCQALALQGVRVIIAGLDMDFDAQPFGSMPQLLAVSDYITKLHAICVHCGNIASFSYRKTKERQQVVLGETDIYEPRCRLCYQLGDGV